jgi:D-alanyl-D-alanine dipeptidase
LRAAILEPLGLDGTAIALSPTIRDTLAPAKVWDTQGDSAAPLFDLGGTPAGNIYSTLGDVARYGKMLLREGEGVVSAESLHQMWRPVGPDQAAGYGLGFAVSTLDGEVQVGHGGVVYGYASTLQLLPETGLGVAMFSTLDFTNEMVGRLSRRALRLALVDGGTGARPKPARRLPRALLNEAEGRAGLYAAGNDGPHIEIIAAASRLTLIEEGVPIEIRPIGQRRYVPDGRIFGEETLPPVPILEVRENTIDWRGRSWLRVSHDFVEPAPGELAAFLGLYGPDFAPTRLYVSGGRLMCLIEYFCPHVCEPLGDKKFLMHGGLYEQEILELDATDTKGRPAIKVGEMILPRLGR